MATQDTYQLELLPEQAQEDELHANRLLAVEERNFQRVTKRLFNDAFTAPALTYQSVGPSEDDPDYASKLQKYREDVLIDFANLDSSLVRIQLILSSNQRERERYATEKAKILETAQAVRDNTVKLRTQLVEAQRMLDQRKGYDEQASKILDDKKLKSRDETKADIEKLGKEIGDLQQESAEYEGTWIARREQFDNIAREGEAMIRLIKGIKDEPEPEPEKDEDMEDGDDDTKDHSSRVGSPAPDGRSPRPTDTGDATPMRDAGEGGEGDEGGEASTPRPTNKFLDVDDATRPGSRVSSPLHQPLQLQDDVDMAETSNAAEQSTLQVSTPDQDVAMDES